MKKNMVQQDNRVAFGMSFKQFEKLYKERNGFNDIHSPNDPKRYGNEETSIDFLVAGCQALIRDHEDIVKSLI